MFSSEDISYAIVSLGCSKNLVDSEILNASLLSAGFRHAADIEEADMIIINTCGFIKDAKEESISVIFDALHDRDLVSQENRKPWHEQGRASRKDFHRKVIVAGCLSQRYFQQIQDDIPEIDLLYGLVDDDLVPCLLREFRITAQIRTLRKREPLVQGLPYAYIKISEGCSNACSYCAIPLIRGPHAPFSSEEILEDARRAATGGALELMVIAQDIASYNWNGHGLVDLVRDMSSIESVRWIRLLYCHPDHCDDAIIEMIGSNDNKVVPYIDLPFQHVSGSILRSMGRRGGYSVYSGLVDRLRDAVPDIRIRSTFMVGYPGETRDDFNDLLRFVNEHALDRVGVFCYSQEEGTRACRLSDDVPDELKHERYDLLMASQQAVSQEKLKSMIGTVVDVLVEEAVDRETYIGRTMYDAPEVDGIFYLTGKGIQINEIIQARVTDSIDYDLMGVPY